MNKITNHFVRYYHKLDKGLLIAVTVCAAISVLLIYSMCQNGLNDLEPSYYITQLVATVLGVGICIVVSSIDYHHLVKLWFIYVPVSLVLVGLTFTGLGLQRAGADDRAWLNLGFTTLQPSEILKLAFILTFSYHLSKDSENINHPLHLLFIVIHGAIPIGLVAFQGDYGTALVFIVMFIVMMFSAGLSIKYIIAAAAAAVPAVYLLWNYGLQSVHKKRILVLIHPGTDPMGLEYQQNLSLAALGSGKLFGKKLFNDDYVTVPEMHNDFMFAYVGQIFGFVGAVVVILILAYICIKILLDSRSTMDLLGKLICLGTFAMLFTHCFMNIGMVMKVMPVIGIPLPFFSAGGTALVSMYVAIGLVLNCYAHNNKKYRMFYDYE
ncbi:MAG: FtsW/RodA/SpoVE family cell cycle protein [Porcipelethomonas sp.]